MIGRKAKAIGPTCEKPWENQGLSAVTTGNELLSVFPMFLKSSKRVESVKLGSSQIISNKD
jgi:hypothetical protein